MAGIKRRIIDAHLHLDDNIPGGAENAATDLDGQLAKAGIEAAVVLHLETQRWPIEEVSRALEAHKRLIGFANIHPFDPDALLKLRQAKDDLNFQGLKLHPRLQSFDISDDRVVELVREAGDLGLPVLMDAFPDGDWLMMGFNPLAFASLAKACPDTKIIFGHMGGHHCIDMMMLAKRIPNIHFDISFSLLYYLMGSTRENILYCCKSMGCQRVMFGSDHPGMIVGEALEKSLSIFSEADFSNTEMENVFFNNAAELLNW